MTSSNKPEKRKLSKSILEMKFMRKSKEKAEEDREEEEGRAAFGAVRIGNDKFVIERSFVPCEDLIVGRLSYHGMNPEIEKLLELEKGLNKADKVKEEAEVSDAEMAKHYSSLVQTMANKFKSKSNRRSDYQHPLRKKPKFLKPEDD